MKYVVAILFLIISLNTNAQREEPPKQALITGRIINNTEPSWKMSMSGYLEDTLINIPVNKEETFSKRIYLSDPQDIRVIMDSLSFDLFVVPGDTLDFSWNQQDIRKTFSVRSPKTTRTSELYWLLKNKTLFAGRYNALSGRLKKAGKRNDTLALSEITTLYNEEMDDWLHTFTAKGYTDNAFKMLTDIYYKYTSLLLSAGLLPTYDLQLKQDSNVIKQLAPISSSYYYKVEDVGVFKLSPPYRRFLLDYIKMHLLRGYVTYNPEDQRPFTAALDDYYRILANIHAYFIRDVFITKVITEGAHVYDFNEIDFIYKDFIRKCRDENCLNYLAKVYSKFETVKPGSVASPFSFPDELNRQVALDEFKGKVVYIDIWATYCAPCLSELKNYAPLLREKYKGKDIVFLNISIDREKDTLKWKKAIKELNISGVNILAAESNNSQFLKDYNIFAPPTYILIDKAGKIVNMNAPGPSGFLTSEGLNQIDKLLLQKK